MLRRPPTVITLTSDDLADFETRHSQRLAVATAARQAQMQRDREERRQRERLEKEMQEAERIGVGSRPLGVESKILPSFQQGLRGTKEDDVFITPTTSAQSALDSTGRGVRLANIRDKRRAAAAASVEANNQTVTPIPPLFAAARAAARDDRIMGTRTAGETTLESNTAFGQRVPGAPARPRR